MKKLFNYFFGSNHPCEKKQSALCDTSSKNEEEFIENTTKQELLNCIKHHIEDTAGMINHVAKNEPDTHQNRMFIMANVRALNHFTDIAKEIYSCNRDWFQIIEDQNRKHNEELKKKEETNV